MVETFFSVLAQSNNGSGAGGAAAGAGAMICSCIMFLIWGAIIVAIIAGMWKMFEKAGQPGWAAIIPIYNMIIWCKIVGRPEWWALLMLIPFLGLIPWIILSIDMAKSFGKDAVYGIGIALLGILFIPMLGFGKAQYQGPSVAAA